MRQIQGCVIILVAVVTLAGMGAAWAAAPTVMVEARAFESKWPTENLEPEVFDFRYAPAKWQMCIGLPDDSHKTMVDNDGRLCYEYKGGAFGYRTWIQARVETEGQAGEVGQHLWDSRIPIVVTAQNIGNLTLRQDVWAGAPRSKDAAKWIPKRVDYLWLKMRNTGGEKSSGRVILNVRSRKRLLLEGQNRLVTEDQPRMVVAVFSPAVEAVEPNQDTREGYGYNVRFEERQLAPGEEWRALVTVYCGKEASANTSEKDAAKEQKRAIDYWQKLALPYGRLVVPDEQLQGLVDSCIRNIYQAREMRNDRLVFQVGPTCYRGTWAADGPFILEAVTYLGRWKEARSGLENQVDKDDGPSGKEFSKKSGLRLWMMRRHWELTGDTKWLEKMWPRVEREVNQIIEYRRMTRDDANQPNFGLMPPGFGDGGLAGKHREYTNVYWTLAGLKTAVDMAKALDKPCANGWQVEYEDYRETFDKARQRDKTTDYAGNVFVPVVMKGGEVQLPQRGAWAFMHSIFPGEIYDADDELMLGTLAMLDANQREGLIYGTGWIADGIWNYAGSFYAHSHLWLGHGKKSAATMYAFANHACPMLCWREEQNPKGQKENYIGDMPHNWASAEFIRLVRHSMILERGNEMHLLEGLPTAWTKAGNKTQLKDVPTTFGQVSICVRVANDGKNAEIEVSPPTRRLPEKIVVHLEQFGSKIKSIRHGDNELTGTACRVCGNKNFVLKVEFAD